MGAHRLAEVSRFDPCAFPVVDMTKVLGTQISSTSP